MAYQNKNWAKNNCSDNIKTTSIKYTFSRSSIPPYERLYATNTSHTWTQNISFYIYLNESICKYERYIK